jgi:hypothetical protein
MSEPKRITVYHTPRGDFAGVALTRKKGEGDAPDTWTVKADGFTPAVGDTFRAADGTHWEVSAVGEPERGAYPLTCTPEGGE